MKPVDRALTTFGLRAARSTKDLTGPVPRDMPADPDQYELLDDCGRGVSATVHRALCKPLKEIVAVKRLNLDSMNCNLEEIIAEAQTMKSYNHPNVLSLYTSFVCGQELWMITQFMTGGSVLHIMKYAYPEGLEEPVIATIMREVLKGLEYVHKNGGIHRDVKAGNILMDKDGTIKIGDFGVAATLQRGGSWGNDKVTRTTFVGTPCWMAPEVMEQTQGYDSSADIWSFGITLLELANGHAPFAKFPPMKVLLMTLQNPPPQLDDQSGRRHFSKLMRDVVTRCLQKDPTKRPTASQLLEHKFFKQGRDEEYLRTHLLAGLPPLSERVQQIRQGKAATNAAENDRRLERSQEEYVKGVSLWNFDLAALKAQAAQEPDDGSVPPTPNFHPSMPTILEGPEDSGRLDAGVPSADVAAIAAALERGMNAAGSGSGSRRSTADEGSAADGGSRPATPGLPSEEAAASSSGVAAPRASGSVDGVAPLAGGGTSTQAGTQLAPPAASGAANASLPRRTVSAFAGSNPSAAAAATLAASGAPPFHPQHPQPPHATAATADGALNAFLSEPMPGAPAGGAASGVAVAGSASASGSSNAVSSTVPMWSPPSSSPLMSRESSSQGPLSALATPTAVVAKQKKHGRFHVYDQGEVPPPMSPPAGSRQLSEQPSVGALFRDPQPLSAMPSEHRISDSGDLTTAGGATSAGPKPQSAADNDALVAAAGAVVAAATATAATAAAPKPPAAAAPTAGLPPTGASTSTTAAAADGGDGAAGASEPKQRGRFKIIQEEGPSRGSISKVSSSHDLRLRAEASLQRPLPNGLMPQLQVLAEQAAAHHAALQKLLEAMARDGAAAGGVNSPVATATNGPTAMSAAAPIGTSSSTGSIRSAPATANLLPSSASTPVMSTSGVAATAQQQQLQEAVAVARSRPAGPSSLSRSTSVTQRSAMAASDVARRSVAAALEKGEGAVDVAERLQDRVLELERKIAELQDDNARLKLRAHELPLLHAPGAVSVTGDATDSAASSRAASRRTSAANIGPLGGTGSGATSVAASPLLSPRQDLTPQPSADGAS